ncbi:MAG TPA: hypothetical protein VK997_06915 [Deferrisomatales bacterium]|nr:hypothetical protein [Deferrisomatales bacterium]
MARRTASSLVALVASVMLTAGGAAAGGMPPIAWEAWLSTPAYGSGDFRIIVPEGDGGATMAGEVFAYQPELAGGLFVARLDGAGAELWRTVVDSVVGDRPAFNEYLGGLTAAPGGGYYVAGNAWVAPGPVHLPYDGPDENAHYNAYLVKLDGNGVEQWRHYFRPSEVQYICSMIPGTDGGLVLLGNSMATGSYDTVVVKVDATGAVEWQDRRDEFAWYYTGSTIIPAAGGGYFTATVGTNFYRLFVRRYTQDGRLVWETEQTAPWSRKSLWSLRELGSGDLELAMSSQPPEFPESPTDALRQTFSARGRLLDSTVVQTSVSGVPRGGLLTADGGMLIECDHHLVKVDGDNLEQWVWRFDPSTTWSNEVWIFGMKELPGGYLMAGRRRESTAGIMDYGPWAVKLGVSTPPSARSVQVDVAPGHDKVEVHLGKGRLLDVAVLSSADFDPLTVDPETVAFAGAAVAWAGNSENRHAKARDVDGDGYDDLVLSFRAAEIDTAIPAILTGKTVDGQSVEGIPAVVWKAP